MELKLNTENNNNIEYLDLLISRQPEQLDIDILQKPTTTDITFTLLLTTQLNKN